MLFTKSVHYVYKQTTNPLITNKYYRVKNNSLTHVSIFQCLYW